MLCMCACVRACATGGYGTNEPLDFEGYGCLNNTNNQGMCNKKQIYYPKGIDLIGTCDTSTAWRKQANKQTNK